MDCPCAYIPRLVSRSGYLPLGVAAVSVTMANAEVRVDDYKTCLTLTAKCCTELRLAGRITSTLWQPALVCLDM